MLSGTFGRPAVIYASTGLVGRRFRGNGGFWRWHFFADRPRCEEPFYDIGGWCPRLSGGGADGGRGCRYVEGERSGVLLLLGLQLLFG